MSAHIEHEAAFIRAFIIAAKQERLVELLAKPKRRHDVLKTLFHFTDLDPRFLTKVSSAEETGSGIEALLRQEVRPSSATPSPLMNTLTVRPLRFVTRSPG